MSEVQLLTDQIDALILVADPLRSKTMMMVIGGMMFGVMGLIFGTMMRNIGVIGIGVFGVVIFIIAITVMAPVMVEKNIELQDLKEQRIDLIRQEIKDMGCDEMRLDIIKKIEDGQQPYYMQNHYEFEKDLYYHRCEIPLRDEVLKLQ